MENGNVWSSALLYSPEKHAGHFAQDPHHLAMCRCGHLPRQIERGLSTQNNQATALRLPLKMTQGLPVIQNNQKLYNSNSNLAIPWNSDYWNERVPFRWTDSKRTVKIILQVVMKFLLHQEKNSVIHLRKNTKAQCEDETFQLLPSSEKARNP